MPGDVLRPEDQDAFAAASRRTIVWMTVLGLVPTVALLILYAFDVPIGQPFFLIYRYSPFPLARAATALVALLVGCLGLLMVYRLTRSRDRASARWTSPAALTVFAALAAWTFVAPPQHVEQHVFNMQSPSHEGAFVLEARSIESISEYVGGTFYERIQNTPEEMLGRRVLSNPPGMTVLFVLCRRAVAGSDSLARLLIRCFDLDQVEDPGQRIEFAAAILYAMLLTLAWGLSIVPAYALGRLHFPPLLAMCLAFACVFNPATVNFTPGKDPAQLLTVMALLYLWFDSVVRQRSASAVLAGVVFVAGLSIGLIHVWVLGIMVLTTIAQVLMRARAPIRPVFDPKTDPQSLTTYRGGIEGGSKEGTPMEFTPVMRGLGVWTTSSLAPFAIGATTMCLLFYVTIGWNVPGTAYAVAVRYREIQVPIITDPFYWTLVGVPMFVLFIGPYVWASLATLGLRRDAGGAAMGRSVLVFSIAVMTLTYFLGNNNETPRLWIPFIPLLVYGVTLFGNPYPKDTPQLRLVCLFLMALQLVGTLTHWTMMDVRESEYRLSTGRMWN